MFAFYLVLLACGYEAAARVYERCELARELQERHEIPRNQIATWVCIARYESEFNTSAVNWGSGDHGLFQISELWWCTPNGSGNACGLNCAELENDDIEDDVICARRIFREHTRLSGDGFNAWVVYNQHCRGNVDKYVEGCFRQKANDKINEITTQTTLHQQTNKNLKPTQTVQLNQNSKNIKINNYIRRTNKMQHKFIDHPGGSRYKYHINKSGFALFKEN